MTNSRGSGRALAVSGGALAGQRAGMSTGGRLRASVRYVDPGRGGTAGGQETTTPINTFTNTAGPKIKVGRSPTAIAITPDGKTAYVVNYRSDSVTPIRIATNTALAPIPVGRHPRPADRQS
jgi:YVTN family beta-propeller protein